MKFTCFIGCDLFPECASRWNVQSGFRKKELGLLDFPMKYILVFSFAIYTLEEGNMAKE